MFGTNELKGPLLWSKDCANQIYWWSKFTAQCKAHQVKKGDSRTFVRTLCRMLQTLCKSQTLFAVPVNCKLLQDSQLGGLPMNPIQSRTIWLLFFHG